MKLLFRKNSCVHKPLQCLVALLFICLILLPVGVYAAEKDSFQFTKQPDLQQIKPKKPVRIKLRRSPKDEYTWELSGDDAEEIVKADRKLRKMLNVK